MKNIEVKNLFKLRNCSDLDISDSQKRMIFLTKKIDQENNRLN